MFGLPDYQIVEELYSDNSTIVYRGFWENQQKPVIIKALRNPSPSLEEISFLHREYNITKCLNLEGIVKAYALEQYGQSLAIILEDFGGVTAEQILLSRKKIELIDFLEIALQLTDVFIELHHKEILHRNVKLSNIFINLETPKVKITGFFSADFIGENNQDIISSNISQAKFLDTPLSQNVNNNFSLDYCEDYYALGIALYEMLVSEVDAGKLSLAEKQNLLETINSPIPQVVSDIIMKLLARNPEDRYQTAWGLKYDLDFCCKQMKATGKIPEFQIGLYDNFSDCPHFKQTSSHQPIELASLLNATLTELKETQLQLLQSEKLSSLGQMVTGLTHEINNPINCISLNLNHVSNYVKELLNLLYLYQEYYPQPVEQIHQKIEAIDLNFIQEDLPKILLSLKLGSERIKEISYSLRNFSRQDAEELTLQDIHESIDTACIILQHRFKAQSTRPEIEIIKEYGELPLVKCYAGLVNQVFMNLLANAVDALEESFVKSPKSTVQSPELLGSNTEELVNLQIKIRTEVLDNNRVEISIADNGDGMTEKVRQKLFQQFFTTKPKGKGTGIGLSISRQIIVDKHGGDLKCISAPGQGAEFIVELPVNQEQHRLEVRSVECGVRS